MADRTPRCTSWMFAQDLCMSKIYVIHNIVKCICKYFIYNSRIPNVAKMPMPFWRTCLWYFICCTPRCTNHVKNVCAGFTVDISSICKRVNKYQISNFPSYEWISKSAFWRQRQDLQIDTAPEISFGMCAFLWCRPWRSENEKGNQTAKLGC